jgi:hypothetical protein
VVANGHYMGQFVGRGGKGIPRAQPTAGVRATPSTTVDWGKEPLTSGTCEGGGANDWWTPAVHTDRVASGSDQVNGSGPRGQKNFSEFLFFFQSTQKST